MSSEAGVRYGGNDILDSVATLGYPLGMDKKARSPKTLVEAIRYYADLDRCQAVMVETRWPNGVTCPTCGAPVTRYTATRRLFECAVKHPRRQFSVKVGTIFEDSALGLDKWLPAVWMIANCKNGVSSHELARALGVTQKTAWFMLHRIRLAMQTGTFDKMRGEVEADETFVGGAAEAEDLARIVATVTIYLTQQRVSSRLSVWQSRSGVARNPEPS